MDAAEILTKLGYKVINLKDVKPDDHIFPLLDNDATFAKFVTQADKDRMKPELRHQLYQQISAKNALINKYLKKIAEKAEITTNLTMHISRHAFAHIAQEAESAPKTTLQEEIDSSMSKEEKAIELLKGMTPEQIMAVISAINK